KPSGRKPRRPAPPAAAVMFPLPVHRRTRRGVSALPKPLFVLAEGEGFEPSVPCGTHDFQSCLFGRSSTLPEAYKKLAEGVGFEPTRRVNRLTHFECAAFGRSATPPSQMFDLSWFSPGVPGKTTGLSRGTRPPARPPSPAGGG